MSNVDFHYDEFEEEIHEKDHTREERMKRSNKARARRKLVKDKKARQYESGFGGNFNG